jgi:hypothetical protein
MYQSVQKGKKRVTFFVVWRKIIVVSMGASFPLALFSII